jgi:hypothetical protein
VIAAATHRGFGMVRRVVNKAIVCVRLAAIDYQISSTQQYLHECDRDGLIDSLSLRYFRADMDALIVRRAALLRRL